MRVTSSPYTLANTHPLHHATRLTPPSPQPSHHSESEADDAAIDVENEDEEQPTTQQQQQHNAEEMAGKFSSQTATNGHSTTTAIELPANTKTPAMERLLNGLQKPNHTPMAMEEKASGNGSYNHNTSEQMKNHKIY